MHNTIHDQVMLAAMHNQDRINFFKINKGDDKLISLGHSVCLLLETDHFKFLNN